MGIKSFKPTSAARRFYSVSDFVEITKSEPERSLLEHQHSTGGRNHHGRITSRFRGGGHKQRYRLIDFRRGKIGVEAFRCLVRDLRFRNVPKVIETPKADGADVVNLRKLTQRPSYPY